MADEAQRTKELRTLPETELNAKLHSLRRSLWEDRMKAKSGSLQQPHRIGQTRRQLARILTILRERHA